MPRSITVTFVGKSVEEKGLPIDGLINALRGLQDALRLTVGHLGGHRHGAGKPPHWVHEQSRLAIRATRPATLVAELERIPSNTRQPQGEYLGRRALDAIIEWDGREDSTLPPFVVERLGSIPGSLPDDVEVWLGDDELPQRVRVNRRSSTKERDKASEVSSANEPFDLESFLDNPNPKVFDRDNIVRASEPFDVDEFIRYTKEARKDGQG